MNEYGVVELGGYLLSVPGAFLYTSSIYLMAMLAWKLAEDEEVAHFRFTRFTVFALALISTMTLLWIQLGVWFYVKA